MDHFIPKSTKPGQAYEWTNFRLCRTRLNNRKGNHTDVLDPFTVPDRWFTLDFTSFLIRPNSALSVTEYDDVQKTIDRLDLNGDDDYVQERIHVIQEYCLGNADIAAVDARWPFVAREMRAQDFDRVYRPSLTVYFRGLAGP